MKYLYIILITSILCSCIRKTNNTEIEINFTQKQKLKLSTISDSSKIVKLETSKDYLISKADAFYHDSTYFFILDKRQRTIFIFSDSGKYINKINAIGRGEGEYIAIKDVDMDKQMKLFKILDVYQQKIISYDYNGNYIKENKLSENTFLQSFCSLDNGNYLFMHQMYDSNFSKEIWEVDSSFHTHKIYKEHNPLYKFPFIVYNNYSNYKNTFSIYDYFDNKIYSLQDKELKCIYSFKIKQPFPAGLKEQDYYDDNKYKNAKEFYINTGMLETERYYILKYISNKQKEAIVYLKKDKSKFFIIDSIIDETTNSPINISFFPFDDNTICSFLYSDTNEDNPTIKFISLR